MFILTRVTLPFESATAFSNTGASCLQGPHQGAQKSTSTGWRVEATITSALNEAVVTSLTLLAGALAPLPLSIFNPPLSAHGTRSRSLDGLARPIIQRRSP